MNILSIQSWVAYGHVGNGSAMFPLQMLGAEVWAVHTVQFSNHPGHGGFAGQVFGARDIAKLVDGIAARGVLGNCDAVLSGYLGTAAIGGAILDAVARVRAENPRALYSCDPVIGDDGPGVYVDGGIADFLRDQAVPAADILTPNRFELARLTGLPCTTRAEVLAAIAALRARMRPDGPRLVLLTSLITPETPHDMIGLVAVGDEGAFLLETPLIPIAANGAGDAIAALFLYHILVQPSLARALERAASSIYGVLETTHDMGVRELQIVAARAEFVKPCRRFYSTRL